MASEDIEKFLDRCPSPQNGCFASDPEALEQMLYFVGDGGIRTDLQRVSKAATKAAIEGILLDDATYEPVSIEEVARHAMRTQSDPNNQ